MAALIYDAVSSMGGGTGGSYGPSTTITSDAMAVSSFTEFTTNNIVTMSVKLTFIQFEGNTGATGFLPLAPDGGARG